MFFYVIAYDIPCDKRRRKVSDLLEGYGQRVQDSVFECVLSKNRFEALKKRLLQRLKFEEDSLRIYPLSSQNLTQVEIWGLSPPLTLPPHSTLV